MYDTPRAAYFVYSDIPAFDAETDVPTQEYFNNSRFFLTSSGDILNEKNNYATFMLVNYGDEDINYQFTFFQSARALCSKLLIPIVMAVAYMFIYWYT